MEKELNDILQLLKTGKTKKEDFTLLDNSKFLLKIIIILIGSYFVVASIYGICHYYKIDIPKPDKFDKIKNWSGLKIFLAAVITAPIIEELIFRLPLRYSKTYISILFGIIISFVFRYLVDFEFKIFIAYLIGIISGILFYLYFPENGFKKIQNFWKNHPIFIFYFFLVSFSFAHLNNHSEITIHLLLLSPLILLPKIPVSILLGYARLKSGIGSSIALHMINNGIATFFFLLTR